MMGRLKSDQGQLFHEFRLGDATRPALPTHAKGVVMEDYDGRL